jgi:hypothetical protein
VLQARGNLHAGGLLVSHGRGSHIGKMACIQPTLFHPLQQLPEGFEYNEDVLAFEEERALISTFERLPFREFEFRGFLGKRRTVSFGWRYDFNVRELQEAEEIPSFLLELRQKAAEYCRHYQRPAPTHAGHRVSAWRGNRLAPRPARIRRRDRHLARAAMPVPAPSQARHVLGTRIKGAKASFSIPSAWARALGLAAQHPAGR